MVLLGISMIPLLYSLLEQVTLWLRNPVSQRERVHMEEEEEEEEEKSSRNHFAMAGISSLDLSLLT